MAFNTSPANLSYNVGPTAYTVPQILTLPVGTQSTIWAPSPQTGTGTQYTFTNWSDSGAEAHAITISPPLTSDTATFLTSYLLTISANPAGGGSVSPATPTYYPAGSSQSISATPNSGYVFSSWSGSADIADSFSALTSITMNGPETIQANFMTYTAVGGQQVAVTGTGLLYSPLLANPGGGSPGGGTTTFTVTNRSGAPINGPIQLVLTNLPSGVTAANNTGTFMGNPYWTVPYSSSLANNASLTVTVQLNYPSSTAVSTTPAVYTGSF